MNDPKERNSVSESGSGVAISKETQDSNGHSERSLKQDVAQNIPRDTRTQNASQTAQSGGVSATSTATNTATNTATSAVTVTSADRTARNWAVAAHLSGLSLYLGIPFGNILGPLVIWLIKKDESPYAEDQAKEALNFQLSLTIYGIAAALLAFVFIGFLLIPVIFVLHIVLTVVATVKTSEGKAYRYPLTIRLIS